MGRRLSERTYPLLMSDNYACTSLLTSCASCADDCRGTFSDIFLSGNPGNSSAAVPQSKNPSHLFEDATRLLWCCSMLAAIAICYSIREAPNEKTAGKLIPSLSRRCTSLSIVQPVGKLLHIVVEQSPQSHKVDILHGWTIHRGLPPYGGCRCSYFVPPSVCRDRCRQLTTDPKRAFLICGNVARKYFPKKHEHRKINHKTVSNTPSLLYPPICPSSHRSFDNPGVIARDIRFSLEASGFRLQAHKRTH